MESVRILRCNPPSNQQSEEVDCAAGDLEVLCAEGIEAKGADNNGGKLGVISVSLIRREKKD